MKIHHVLYMEKKYGGSESFIEIVRKYSRHEHTIGYAIKSEEKDENIPDYMRLYRNFLNYINSLDEKDFDIVNSHFFIPGFLAEKRRLRSICLSHCLLSREFELAVFDATSQQEEEELRKATSYIESLEAIQYSQIRHLYSFGIYHTREIESLGGNPTKLMMPIDVPEFWNENKTDEARHTLSLPNKFTILFLGRPTYLKGLHIILDAFEDIGSSDMQLVVGGEFYKNELGQVCYDHCVRGSSATNKGNVIDVVDDGIIMVGPIKREQVQLYYSACDVFVCPSLYEAVGTVNLEAMACGKPVITSSVGGMPEYVKDGETGLLFEPNNPKQLAHKIQLLKDSPDLLNKIAGNGKRYVLEHHNAADIVEDLDDIYDKT